MEIEHLTCNDVHPQEEVLRRGAQSEALLWRCGKATIDLRRTRIMGIVNVTPDSFSDGGTHASADEAIAWGMRLLDDGADLLDVGGESTRPGFSPVEPAEEAARIVPVVKALAGAGAVVSVDTRHAQVARAALDAGACVINDVSGFTDPSMVEVAARSDCGVVCMRAGTGSLDGGSAAYARDYFAPLAENADRAADGDGEGSAGESRGAGKMSDDRDRLGREFVGGIAQWLLGQARMLEDAGVSRERICLDPGIGFGTTFEEDLAIQREMRGLSFQGYPVLCALSRKRSMGVVSGASPASERDAASLGAAFAAMTRGCRVLRVHDVAHTSEAFRAAEASWGKTGERRALVALGANLGDRMATLREALGAIDRLPLTRVTAASHAYDTEPAYLSDQPAYANAVVEIATELHPLALLPLLLGIEDAHGRVRSVANGPRTLDLDLLWMEGEIHAGARLTLPHPRIGERDFVLRPLEDVLGGDEGVERFCADNGIVLASASQRVGRVTADLGEILPVSASEEMGA